MFRAVISRSRRFTNHCLLATAAPIPSIGLTGADPPCGTSGGQPQPVFRHCSPRQSRSISSFPDRFPQRLCVENKNGLRWFGSVANGDKRVLYKGKWMVPIYVMVRLKVFQLTAFGSLAVPLNAWMATGAVEPIVWGATCAIVVGSGVASTALWFFSRRYVGEIALIGERQDVRISVMDFWGNREEVDFPLGTVVPPLKGLSKFGRDETVQQPFVPLDVRGSRQFIISLRYGKIVDKELLLDLLEGNLPGSD